MKKLACLLILAVVIAGCGGGGGGGSSGVVSHPSHTQQFGEGRWRGPAHLPNYSSSSSYADITVSSSGSISGFFSTVGHPNGHIVSGSMGDTGSGLFTYSYNGGTSYSVSGTFSITNGQIPSMSFRQYGSPSLTMSLNKVQ